MTEGNQTDEIIEQPTEPTTPNVEHAEVDAVDNVGADIAPDDQEANIDGESGELSELGTDSDGELEEGLAELAGGDEEVVDGKTAEERIEWLEAVAIERETVLSDIMGRASAAVERIDDLERAVKTLQKKLKAKGGDATLHGSVDDL